MREAWRAFLELNETHNKVMKLFWYLLEYNGGFLWPILSFFLFAYAWSNLELFYKIFISIVWTILSLIAALTPIVQSKFNKKREKEYQEKIYQADKLKNDLKANIRTLYSERKKQEWPDGYNNVWEEVYKQVER